MDHLCAQVDVTALADTEQPVLVTGAVLPGRQPQRRCHLPAFAVLLALVTGGPVIALWVVVGYLLANTLVGNIIEPKFLGDRLGLSTLVVFLSLVFWGWVLGTTGMFLSVPLTMVIKLALETHPETRWIAVLLGTGKITAEDA